MKKGVMIAIGVAIAIAIVVTVGLSVNTGKETKIALNSTNVTSVSTPAQSLPPTPQPVSQGRHFSVNLTETVGASAH